MRLTAPGRGYQALALFLCFLVSPFSVFAEAGASARAAGQITSLIPAATRNSTPVKYKDDVHWNDVIQTEKAGRARIGLTDGSILSVGSNTQLKITEHDAETQQTQVELEYGKLRNRVVAITKPDGRYQVHTPNAVASVVGTDFAMTFNPATDVTTVVVYSGTVVVNGTGAMAGRQATVQAGQMVEVSKTGMGTPQATPQAVQLASISDTTTEGNSAAAAGGSHTLRNLLIGLGVAVASVAIGITASGGGSAASSAPTPASQQKPDQK
jgi:hypothetical protein